MTTTTTPIPKSHDKLSKREIRRRLYEQVRQEGPTLAVGSVAMLCSSLSNQALPRLLGRVLDQDTANNRNSSSSSRQQNLTYSLGLVVLGGGVASFLRTTLLNRAKDDLGCRLRQEAFASLMTDKDLEWFQAGSAAPKEESNFDHTANEKKNKKKEETAPSPSSSHGVSPATIGTILTTDIDTISSAFTTSLANILRSTSSILFGTYHMLTLNASLFAASFTIVPLVGAAAMRLRQRNRALALQAQQLASDRADFVQERLEHVMMVKLCHAEQAELQHYVDRNQAAHAVAKRTSLQQGAFMGTVFIASASALLLVVQLGAKAVAQGRMTHGQLTSFATYSFLLGLGTSGLVSAMTEMTHGMVAAERYYSIMDTHKSSDSNENVVDAKATGDHDVRAADVTSFALEDVSFSYRSTGKQVLSKVSFQLKRGQVVALVGHNGCGKSSAVSVLAGLYTPSSGRVVVNDTIDLSTLSKETKNKLIQVIPQSIALFNMSILDNVRYSDSEATEDRVRKALTLANCADFVSKLPGNIHFVIGLNGSKLSGGERQRLALARALLSDPAVLVMDEPASSLDAAGEAAVAQALKACRGGTNGDGKERCILLVTHQPKSLLLADEILVMKDGAVVEHGTLEQLSRPNSHLCHLMPDLIPDI